MGIFMGCSVRNQFDVVIKKGMIYDGIGSNGIRSDIGIIGDKIAAISDLSNSTADRIIDAEGLIVAPGFIDIHAHTDWELLVNSNAESKIRQGVTTEISGNCGYSPFPLNDEDFAELDDYVFSEYDFHITWRNIGDFLQILERKKASVNYGTFLGQGTLRSFVVGRNDIAPTSDQIIEMKNILSSCMERGSLGLSTGLEYAPGSYASTDELIELCNIVSGYDGIYATHMRNEDDRVEEAIEEALNICRNANVSLQISHLKACNRNNWHKVDHMLDMINEAIESGLPVSADRYPYTAWGTGLTIFLPLWSRQGTTEDIISRLKDPEASSEMKKHAEEKGKNIGGWDRVMISYCFTEDNRKWEGITIEECSRQCNVEPFEFVRSLLIEEENRVGIVGFAMDEGNLRKVLTSPVVMIGSDGNSVASYGKLAKGKPHPRFYGTFPRVLGKYCREDKYFNIAEAIKKMTSMPAEKLGLKKRGTIEKGNFSDITIFDPIEVIDKATYADPHRYPSGIDYVIVNGKITVDNGEHTGEHAGTILRSKEA
jgi:N-acyl-D-amino-acid deacylase